MPRPEKPLGSETDPAVELAAGLRRLREKAGNPPYRRLALLAHYSATTLAAAASGQKLPSLAVTLAYARACGGDPREWERRWQAASARTRGGAPWAGAEGCPYKGLAAFQEADAELFFGRDRAVAELLDRLERHPVVALFGASGAGKSSVLRAGLAAGLGNAVVFTPGARPLAECAAAVVRAPAADAARLRDELAADPGALGRELAAAGRPPTLIVDQFEEVFTLCRDPAERDAFLLALLTAAQPAGPDAADSGAPDSGAPGAGPPSGGPGPEGDGGPAPSGDPGPGPAAAARVPSGGPGPAPGPGVRVVLGVRADFYTHCTRFPHLVAALRHSQVMLGPMTAEELGRAITRPALHEGAELEDALLARLVADTEGRAGVLPLLSHALRETWARRTGTVLTLDGFHAAGGIDGALARTAESFYTGLPPARQRLARDLFLRLTAPGEGTEDTKRRIQRAELDDDPDTNDVLERLAAARLVTLGGDSVEIAHEALIRSWPRLHDWLAAHRDGIRVHRQLTDATTAWEALGRDPGSLYRGTRLSLARDWSLAHPGALSARERAFLDAAVAAEDREQAAARRRTRRLRRLVALLTVLVLVATGATAVAIRAGRVATDQRNDSLSREVAAEAATLRALNPALSLQLSLAAYRLAPTREARGGLLSAFAAPYASALTGRSASVAKNPYGRTVSFTADGLTLATSEGDNTVRLWDTGDPHRPREDATITGHRAVVCGTAFSPDGRVLATTGRDSTVRLWDTTEPRRPRRLATITGHAAPACAIAFSPDGRTLATGGEDATVRLWDLAVVHRPRGTSLLRARSTVRTVAFSPDGRTLATGGQDRAVRLWDVSDPERARQRAALSGHTGPLLSVVYSPDGGNLATAGEDGTVRLWSTAESAKAGPVVLKGHLRTVYAVAFAPGGQTLATAGEDQTVRVWDVSDRSRPRPQAVLNGHIAMVIALAFSPDGRTLASASQDHAVRLWDLPAPALSGHGDFVFATAFSADGRTLATTGQDRTVRLWDMGALRPRRTLAVLTGHTGPVYGTAFSPDGRTLATTSEDLTLRLWDAGDPAHPRLLSSTVGGAGNPEGVDFSPDGRLLATTSPDRTVRLHDVTVPARPRRKAVLIGHTDHVRAADFAPDGRILATAGDDRTARLWDVSDPARPRQLAVLTGHTGGVRSVAVGPDGRTAATAGHDRTVRLWDITDPARPRPGAVLTGHTSIVYDVVFAPDGRRLATAGDDRTARLWDVSDPARPRELAALTGHTDRLHHVAFSPDGRTLASTSRDGTALLWETDPERAADRICATAHPAVTRQEWSEYFPGVDYRPPCG
ncbi:nSTAND1 domain-containing NTPase [Streptomyces sp. NPDC003691]